MWGEVGYLDFNKRLKQKAVAKKMMAFNGGLMADISPSKAQKMIAKAIEAQEKADDAAKRSRIAKFASQHRSTKTSARPSRGRPTKTRSLQPRPVRHSNSPRARTNYRRNSSSSYSSKNRGSNHRP